MQWFVAFIDKEENKTDSNVAMNIGAAFFTTGCPSWCQSYGQLFY